MIRIVKDRRYAIPYWRWEEHKISIWLNERHVDSYFDEFITSEKRFRGTSSVISTFERTNFVCFADEKDALAFRLVFLTYE